MVPMARRSRPESPDVSPTSSGRDWLGFVFRPATPARSAIILGLVAAVISVMICAVVYLLVGIFPTEPADVAVQLGLPFLIPLTLAPVMAFEIVRMSARLRERTGLLEAEIAARRLAEERLAVLATIDDLTQTLNRREFFARASQLASRPGPMIVAELDLDHFKLLNDTHGHSAGDEALRRYGQVLHEAVADERDPVIGRLGGEEFGVILPERAVGDGAPEVFRRILDGTRAVRDGLTTSIGVSDWHPTDETIDAALARADGALYRAKQLGRDRIEVALTRDHPGGVPSDGSPIARR